MYSDFIKAKEIHSWNRLCLKEKLSCEVCGWLAGGFAEAGVKETCVNAACCLGAYCALASAGDLCVLPPSRVLCQSSGYWSFSSCILTISAGDHVGNSLLPALEKSMNQFDQVLVAPLNLQALQGLGIFRFTHLPKGTFGNG